MVFGRNFWIFLLLGVFSLVLSSIFSLGAAPDPPEYWDNSTNSTLAGEPVEFRLRWTCGYELVGYIFSLDNCTGSFENITIGSLSGYEDWSNVTHVINSTVGCTIRWKVYANNTNLDWSTSDEYSFETLGCGAYINSDTKLINDITGCTDTILYINASDITLDCDNHYLQSSGGYGINNTAGFNNVTIKNCEINMTTISSDYGIRYWDSDNGTIQNNNITTQSSSAHSIYLYYSDSNTVSSNNITTNNNSAHGIRLHGSKNNTISNNDIITYNTSSATVSLTSSELNKVLNNTLVTYQGSAYGIHLHASPNNTLSNNNITTHGLSSHAYGLYICTSSNFNTISNNNVTTSGSNGYGTFIYLSDSNTVPDNSITTLGSNAYGVYLYNSSNNSITGGSIVAENTEEYYLRNASITNLFRNTNFTVPREIYFYDTTSWFNYNNQSSSGVWLNTSVSDTATLERELTSLTQSLVQWNDTNTSGTGVTATYNISGLLLDTTYNVYNNSVLAYTRQTSSNDWINFTIYLGSEHEIKVEESGDTTSPTITWENPTPPDGNVTSNNWVYLNATITDSSNTSAFFDWNYSLLGYWSFEYNNSTHAFDNSSYESHCIFEGTSSSADITTGKYGNAMGFDGANDYIGAPDNPSIDNITEITIEAWIKASNDSYPNDNDTDEGCIVRKWAWDYTGYHFDLVGRRLNLYLGYGDGTTAVAGMAFNSFNPYYEKWTHVVARGNQSTLQLYINGIFQKETAVTKPYNFSNTQKYQIGGGSGNSGEWFNGSIDEVRIYKRALSPEEINASYNNKIYRLEHNFTSLPEGTYDYTAWVIDSTGNMNKTSRNVTVDTTAPKYWDNSTNSTLKGEPVEFRLRWTDNIGLSGYIFSFCNGTWNGAYCIGDISLWPNSTFTRCKNISISNSGSSTLTDFPAYINLSKNSNMLSDYSDLRFYNSSCNNGGNELDYEIENYTTDNAHLWVRIPSLPSPGTTISVYYSNNTPVESGENQEGVWDSSYKMVQHMQIISGSINDSTSNDNDGSLSSAPYNIPGMVGNAIQFDGIDDAIDIPYSSTLEPINLTYEVWGRITGMNSDSGTDALFGSKRGKDHYNNNDGMQFTVQAYMDIGQRKYRALYERDTISPQQHMLGSAEGENNTWYHLTTTFDEASDTAEFYINASLNATESGMESEIIWYNDNTVGFVFGRIDRPTPRYYNCTIDEVRISDVIRSSDWINQTYQMVQNQGSFVNFGSEESSTGWQNDTWTQMTGLENWSNVTKVVNSTVGATIAWKVYANDTFVNWNVSETYSFVTVDFFELTGKVLFWENATPVSGATVVAKIYDGPQFLGQSFGTTDSSGGYLIKIPLTLEEDKKYLANITATKGSYQAYLKHYFRL